MGYNIVETNSPDETREYAEDIARSLKMPTIIALHGELGAGKTTLTQGFAQGLGIKQKISSPTFIIMRQYTIKKKMQKVRYFYHVDLYRIDTEDEVKKLGLLDIIDEQQSIIIIEWPENMGELLPNKRLDITLDYIDENKRKLKYGTG